MFPLHSTRRSGGWLRLALSAFTLLGLLAAGPAAVAQAAANAPPAGYARCAAENQFCEFSGAASVVYGAGATWTAPRTFTGNTVSCSNQIFGDPLPNVVKACYAMAVAAPPAPPAPPATDTPPAGYTRCAGEGGNCGFTGTSNVVYGALGSWTAPRSFTNGTACTNQVFGDPAYGTVKSCYRQEAAAAKVSLSLTISGTGGVGFSDGSACSASCVKTFDSGAGIVLSASASAGHTFAGWGGACSGGGATCTLSMGGARSVSATFNAVAAGSGKVYYVDANAADDNGAGTAASPKKHLSSGAALLSAAGGDTLIVKAGTYGDAKDVLRNEGSGKAGSWNVIRAEVDGTATITVPLALGLADHYLRLEGLKWDGPHSRYVTGRYVKILRCAFKGGPLKDNTVNFGIGTNDATPGAQHILVEDSHFHGVGGRYAVLVYNSDKVVLRRLVVRHEPGWSDTKGDPEAGVSLYNSTDVLTQNLVVLDSAGGKNFASAIFHPSNSRASGNIRNVGAMVLNTAGSGVGWGDSAAVNGMTLEDSAVIGSASVGVVVNGGVKNVALKNVTVARSGSHGTGAYGSNTAANFSVADSIVAGNGGEQFKNGITATNVSGVLPPWPTRPVGTTGATILKRLGKPGTLWGEPGFDQAQAESLWPFPNEAAIRKSMCADAGVTTGLCASASLTRYVWEQFGTPLPADYASTAPGAVNLLTVAAGAGGGVTSSPAGIQCTATGSGCSAGFAAGSAVRLTAAPAAGQVFAGWGGACSGTAANCTVTLDAPKSVNANFTAAPAANRVLTVTIAGTGGVGFSARTVIGAGSSGIAQLLPPVWTPSTSARTIWKREPCSI